jgi:tetratricopeptide (TPR) repeat protein
MKRIITLVLVGIAVVAGALLIPRALLRAHESRVAERHQHVAQAICDFRARHGLLPDTLEELVPAHLPALPAPTARYSKGLLTINAGFPGVYVSYWFSGEREGWFGSGPLPVPKVTPSVAPASGDALVRARLAAYDRRVALSPEAVRHRTDKIAYLVSLGRAQDAYSECRAAAAALPGWWRPQMGLAALAPPAESGEAEARFRSWVDRHPAFIHYWYLARYYRDRGRTGDSLAALRQGAKHPLEGVDPDAGWVPRAFAFNAAAYACERGEPGLVLAITDSWASVRGVYKSASPDPDLPAFRAAALLALGRFDEARRAADAVLATSRERRIWAGNLDRLDAAIRREDRSFVYDPGDTCRDSAWSLFPPAE